MPILIFGAGAIGQWLGALLFSNGCSVQLHGRPSVGDAIAARGGISLDGSDPLDVPFSTSLDELSGQHFSSVICTVKTFAVEAALKELQASGASFDELVSFQNGWGTEPYYSELFPDHPLWVLTTTRAIGVDAPGDIRQASKGGLAVAPWDPESTTHSSPVAFRRLPIPLVQPERGVDQKWSKLLLNVMGNATGAVTGLAPGVYAEHSKLMRLELLLVREAMRVGRAFGIERVDLPGFPIRAMSAMIEKLPLPVIAPIVAKKMKNARGEKLPSLFEDLKHPEAPSEFEAMNGAVVRIGAQLGVPTPYQSLLMEVFQRCRQEPAFWERLRNNPDRLADLLNPKAKR